MKHKVNRASETGALAHATIPGTSSASVSTQAPLFQEGLHCDTWHCF